MHPLQNSYCKDKTVNNLNAGHHGHKFFWPTIECRADKFSVVTKNRAKACRAARVAIFSVTYHHV